MTNFEHLIWSEKYRPDTIEQCILPAKLKETFQQFVEKKAFPHLLLAGSPGTGKTTVAKALCKELEFDHIVINGSLNGGIDTLRTKITDYASTLSINGERKCVILDEADGLTGVMQPALRNFLEQFSDVCSFILTCNNKNQIIEPLHSRLSVIDFHITKAEKAGLLVQLLKRVFFILKNENISFDQKAVVEFVKKYFPDNRKILNELQRYSVTGQIDDGILAKYNDCNTTALIDFLKDKDFTKVKNWVAENVEADTHLVLRTLYDSLYEIMEKDKIPSAVMILAEYQYKHAFAADKEINLVACLTELMFECF